MSLSQLSPARAAELISAREFTAQSISKHVREDKEFEYFVNATVTNAAGENFSTKLELAEVAEYWVSREGYVWYKNVDNELYFTFPLAYKGEVVARGNTSSIPHFSSKDVKSIHEQYSFFRPLFVETGPLVGIALSDKSYIQSIPVYQRLTDPSQGPVTKYESGMMPALIGEILRRTKGAAFRLCQIEVCSNDDSFRTKVGVVKASFAPIERAPDIYELDFDARNVIFGNTNARKPDGEHRFDLRIRAKLSYQKMRGWPFPEWMHHMCIAIDGENSPAIDDLTIPRVTKLYFEVHVPFDLVLPTKEELKS